MKTGRPILLAAYLAAMVAGLFPWAMAAATAKGPSATVLTLDNDIDRTHLGYLKSGLSRAQADRASIVLVRIDTPGGDIDSMRGMVQAILAAPLPVITFVAPDGARAGSAGTFVAAAGNIAAMAPTSNIGAATPISSSGADLPDTLKSKAINDASALIRSIAETRGRNADKLESTVREAASYTAQQAVDLRIVDLIATSNNDLLVKVNGRVVQAGGRSITLDTQGISCDPPMAQCGEVGLSFTQRALVFISNPTVALLLFVVGALGVLVELLSPGLIAPGVFGAIALALAFISFGNLPVNWVGVGLVLFGFALVLFEFHIGAFGAVGAGGIVAFIIGLLLLFEPFSPSPPSISRAHIYISPWLIGGLAGGLGAAFAGLLFLAWRGKRAVPCPLGAQGMVGKTGRVTSDLTPLGTVQAESELWTAESADGTIIRIGEPVLVTAVTGLVLKVVHHPVGTAHGTPAAEMGPGRRQGGTQAQ